MTNTLRGYLDNYANGHVIGWACDTALPDLSVTVELIIDDVPVHTSKADIIRTDLKKAGFGNGHHGFKMTIPPTFFDSAPHKVGVRIAGAEGDLQHSPQVMVFGDRPINGSLDMWRNYSAKPVDGSVISIVMPTYNRCDTMERTVRALARCSRWKDSELIVTDDGSRDDTPNRLTKLCREFPNIRTARIENSGPATARNLAVTMASSPLLLFVGDDVEPVNEHFIDAHLRAHEQFPDRGAAVLGKITWPAHSEANVNFVMRHVQGDGQQQFGYKYMEPYKWYDWQLFYSSNISLKRSLVDDWAKDGYDESFDQYGYEDAELGYRLAQQQKVQGRKFELLYVPAAVLAHDHPYSVSTFMRRQTSSGLMARHFFEKHPEVAADIGVQRINEKLAEPMSGAALPIEHYFTVFEGFKSWALVLEHHDALGSQNWHSEFLNAIFRLAFFEGYLRRITRADANLPLAAKYVLDQTLGALSQSIFRELIGSMPQLRLV